MGASALRQLNKAAPMQAEASTLSLITVSTVTGQLSRLPQRPRGRMTLRVYVHVCVCARLRVFSGGRDGSSAAVQYTSGGPEAR